MNITPIKPSGIALLTTLRCTAACDNCCFGCTPIQGRSMTFEEMKEYVDMSIEAYPDSISSLDLTGGECMLLGKDIDKILAYAKSKGLKCFMVSNAFWASDYDKAYKTLKRLKSKGLTKVSFSTGNDHNQYVPWQNVRNAAVAAARLGFPTEIRVEDRIGYMSVLNHLNGDIDVVTLIKQGKLSMTTSPWMEYPNKAKKSRSWKIPLRDLDKPDPCKSLFENIIINPYGEVYACCGIGVCHIPQMRLGNIHQDNIKTIYERAFRDFLKIWLFTKGPHDVLKFVSEKTGQKFNWHTTHHCDLCRIIFTDKAIIPFIKEHFYDVAYFPLLSYEVEAKQANETRTKR